MSGLYLIANGPMNTTAKFAAVATGTAIKTMLQIKTFNLVRIVEWGISFNAFTPATPIVVELIDTGTVFGTVTASADADIYKLEGSDQAVASVAGLTLGTSATGYTCTSEGSITAVKHLDGPQFITNTASPFVKQFPFGMEPRVIIGNCGRIRVHAPADVNCYTWMKLAI